MPDFKLQYKKMSLEELIVLSQKDDTFAPVAIFEYEWILQEIREAEPTRIMSVNDYPAVKEYYVINVVSTTRSFRYFVYLDDSQVYVELPYEGIYKISQQFYDRLEEYFLDHRQGNS